MSVKYIIYLFILIFSFQYIICKESSDQYINMQNITNILNNLQKLKNLENKDLKKIIGNKKLENSHLSEIWYKNTYKNLFWNKEKQILYFIDNDNKEINIEKMLKCKIEKDCYLDLIIFDFLNTNHENNNFNKFIIYINSAILKRINLLESYF